VETLIRFTLFYPEIVDLLRIPLGHIYLIVVNQSEYVS
jgi:hypothetical protein